MKRPYLDQDARRAQLLNAALPLAEEVGCAHVTQHAVAKASGVSGSLIPHYFGSMCGFRLELMRLAIRKENLLVIARGLADDDDLAKATPQGLRDRAICAMVNLMSQ